MKKYFSIFKKLGLLTVLLTGLQQNSFAQTYCTPLYDFQYSCPYDFARIQSFSVSGIDGSELFDHTPCNEYTDLTGTIPALQMAAGRIYYGSIGINNSSTSYGVWIDYNNDGTFSDMERVSFAYSPNFMFAIGINTTTLYRQLYSIAIQVPGNAPTGQHRMRVRSSFLFTTIYPAETPPCARRYAGSSADYLINITSANTCAPIFTTQPVSQLVCGNGNISFTAGTDISASLQWQINSGSGFTNIVNDNIYSGATTGTLTITGATIVLSGLQYRCVATNGSCTSVSQYATYWQKQPTTSTILADKSVVLSGSTDFTFSCQSPLGSPATLQWQVDKGNGFSNLVIDEQHYSLFISGNLTTLTLYNIPASFNNYKYRVAMTNNICTGYSNASTLTVQSIPMPEYYYTKNATISNTVPIGAGSAYKTQLLYLPGDFGNDAKSGVIKKIYVKAANTTTLPTTYANLKIDIGNTTTTSLTSYVSGLTNVLNASSYTISAATAENWIGIDLTTPIYIDITKPMVVEISTTSKTGPGISIKTGGTPVNATTYTGNTQIYNVVGSTTVTTRRYSYQFGFDMCDINIISQPSNITVNADAGQCSATNVSLGNVTAASACGNTIITNNAPAIFPKGVTTVTWTITDGYTTQTLNQTVTVVDNQAPVISCPSNITVTATTGECSAIVSYTTPTATDNCGSCSGIVPDSIPGFTLVGTYNGHSYFRSTYIEHWEWFDSVARASGGYLATVNSADEDTYLSPRAYESWIGLNDLDSFNVFKWRNGEPTNYTNWCTNEPNNAGNEYYGIINWQGWGCWNDGHPEMMLHALVEFDCAVGTSLTTIRTVGPASGNSFPVGTTVVTYAATDASGNSSSCSFTVSVLPSPNNNVNISVTPSNNTYTGGIPTTIYLGYGPQSVTLNATPTGGTGFTYNWSPAIGLNCTNCQNPVFTPTTAGSYTYTVTATNNNGCSATKSVTLCVLDVRAPNGNDKVYLCHNGNTISINSNAVPAHLNNHSGDKLGSCSQSCGSSNKGEIAEVTYSAEEVKIYPNPNNGYFTVELPGDAESAEVSIMNMTGKMIDKKSASSTKIQFSLTLPKGVYMVAVKTAHKMNYSKVVIQ